MALSGANVPLSPNNDLPGVKSLVSNSLEGSNTVISLLTLYHHAQAQEDAKCPVTTSQASLSLNQNSGLACICLTGVWHHLQFLCWFPISLSKKCIFVAHRNRCHPGTSIQNSSWRCRAVWTVPDSKSVMLNSMFIFLLNSDSSLCTMQFTIYLNDKYFLLNGILNEKKPEHEKKREQEWERKEKSIVHRTRYKTYNQVETMHVQEGETKHWKVAMVTKMYDKRATAVTFLLYPFLLIVDCCWWYWWLLVTAWWYQAAGRSLIWDVGVSNGLQF